MAWLPFVLWIAVPALGYASLLYAYDLHEREPVWALSVVFMAGLLAVPVAGQLEWLVDASVPFLSAMHEGDERALFFGCFAVIAPIEELLKLVLVAALARRRLMNEPVDGVVYAGMVALGFASGEGIVAGLESGDAHLPMRALLSMPGHLGFSALWGAGLGALRHWGRPALGPFVLTLLASLAAHGGYDYLLLVQRGAERGAVVTLLCVTFVLAALCFRALLEVSPFRGATTRAGSCPGCRRRYGPLSRFCAGCGGLLALRAPRMAPIAFTPTLSAFGAAFVLGSSLVALSARFQGRHFVTLAKQAASGGGVALSTLSLVLLATSAFAGFVAGSFHGRRASLEATVATALVLLSGFLWLALRAPGAMPRLLPAVPVALGVAALIASWVRRRVVDSVTP